MRSYWAPLQLATDGGAMRGRGGLATGDETVRPARPWTASPRQVEGTQGNGVAPLQLATDGGAMRGNGVERFTGSEWPA